MSDLHAIQSETLPGRSVAVNGEEFLFFSGTSYLGIPHNQEFRALLLESMRRYGSNYSSSRKSNLHLQVYEQAENYLANYIGAEAALTMSSGFLAAQTLVQTLQGNGYFCYAPGTHPALWRSAADGAPHGPVGELWSEWLLQHIPELPHEHLIIVCNSLDPLQARSHSFDWVAKLPAGRQMTLVVDDSHGFGITGIRGAGIYKELKPLLVSEKHRLVVVSSLGKALGIPAGVVAGEKQLVTELFNSTYFAGASPAMPAYLHAFLQAGNIFEEARQRLLANMTYFCQSLADHHIFRHVPGHPVFFTEHQSLYSFLLQCRVLISSFSYPSPSDAPVTRVVLSSLHTQNDLEYLISCLNSFQKASAGA